MKAIHKIAFALLAGLIGLTTACDDNSANPTLKTPSSFTLNTPTAAENTVYDLEHVKNVELTCVQPDYGFSAATVYAVQVSLDNDFATEGKFITLPTTYPKGTEECHQ